MFGFKYAADYKISFLFAEAILQFTQTYLNTKINIIADTRVNILILKKIYRNTIAIAFLSFVAVTSLHGIYGVYTKKYSYSLTFFGLSIYFVFKSAISFHENVFSVAMSGNVLMLRAIVEVSIRFFIIYFIVV